MKSKELVGKIFRGILSPKKAYQFFYYKVKSKIDAIKLKPQLEKSDRIIAIFIHHEIHFNFIHDTIRILIDKGYSFHFYSLNENFIGRKLLINDLQEVKDHRILKHLPYKVLLTPWTFGVLKIIHHKTKVIHMPHSIVSIHDIYSEKVFLNFDLILCVGPHHVRELRSLLKNDIRKHFIAETGYEIVDRLILKSKKNEIDKSTILFAPSWHKDNLLRKLGEKIINVLINKYNVILRPHPISLDLDADIIDKIKGKYEKTGRFSLDNNVDATGSYAKAAAMISDYSGAAFEFALGFKRPVVFLDGPKKINNPNWNKYMDEEGIQVTERSKIGVISDLASLSDDIDSVLDKLKEWETKIEIFTPEILFNPGKCANTAASQIISVMDNNLNVFERID